MNITNKKVLAYGVWDLFHYGHYKFLKKLDEAQEVVIGVLSDELATKWKRKPIMNQNERLQMVRNMGYFHEVFIVNENNYRVAMEIFKPDLVVHGNDDKNSPSIQIAKELGIKTQLLPYTNSISTTEIIRRCKNDN